MDADGRGLGRRAFMLGAGLALPAVAQRDWTGKEPIRYPDPDIVVLDPRFAKLKANNAAIERLYYRPQMGGGSGVERRRAVPGYGAISRTTGRCAGWRKTGMSACSARLRIIRTETRSITKAASSPASMIRGGWCGMSMNGAVTVLADNWQGKPLNAPNDIVVHPDGGIWFSDPGYGITSIYEGHKAKMEIKEAVYRIDPKTAKMEMVHRRSLQAERIYVFRRTIRSCTFAIPGSRIIPRRRR